MLDLAAPALGTRIQDPFLVLEVETRATADGNPYTVLVLGNATGSLATEPFWIEKQEAIAGIRRGHVVQVVGEVVSYRDRKQIRATSVRPLPSGAAEAAGLLPTVGPVEKYWETLDAWRAEVQKPRLAGVLGLWFHDEEFRARFEQCPASLRGHHAVIGGLLKHTTEVAAIGRTVARVCGADQDLVLAGALLHDVGKLDSYSWSGPFELTERGALVGHVVLGALMLERRLNEEPEPPCTPEEKAVLLHLILSHHGRGELGAPVTPLTLEAEVLHWADNASAKTASFAEALRNAENFPEGALSTPQHRLDRRRLYKGQSDWGRTQP